MKSKRMNMGCGIALAISISGIIIFFLWMHHTSKYYVETYKPEKIINADDINKLRDRFVEYKINYATLLIEWNTYDNPCINKPPYKLFIRTKPNNAKLESISVVSINIYSSSTEKKYHIVDKLPVYIFRRNSFHDSISSKKFEPEFHFNHHENEKIEFTLQLEIVFDGRKEDCVIQDTFCPIKVKHYAPLV